MRWLTRVLNVLSCNNLNMSNSHPLEVLARGSEPQLQVGEKLGYLSYYNLIHLIHVSQCKSKIFLIVVDS